MSKKMERGAKPANWLGLAAAVATGVCAVAGCSGPREVEPRPVRIRAGYVSFEWRAVSVRCISKSRSLMGQQVIGLPNGDRLVVSISSKLLSVDRGTRGVFESPVIEIRLRRRRGWSDIYVPSMVAKLVAETGQEIGLNLPKGTHDDHLVIGISEDDLAAWEGSLQQADDAEVDTTLHLSLEFDYADGSWHIVVDIHDLEIVTLGSA